MSGKESESNAFRRKVRESDVTPFKVNGQKRFKIFLTLLCRRTVMVVVENGSSVFKIKITNHGQISI